MMPACTSAQPELFTNPPEKSSSAQKKGQLSDEQVQQYFSEGFLLVPEFFERSELEPIITAICELVDNLAEKLHSAGKIKGKTSACNIKSD